VLASLTSVCPLHRLTDARPLHPRCPAEPSSGPCCRPRPSTGAAARDDGAATDETATDEAPWAEEEAGRSSANGGTELSKE
jgi:hypothetical protein